MFWLRFIVIFFAIAAYNGRDRTPSPRYWATPISTDSVPQRHSRRPYYDSLFRVAERKADSTLGVKDYLREMEKLNEELK